MINELLQLADYYDKKGKFEKADIITQLLKKQAMKLDDIDPSLLYEQDSWNEGLHRSQKGYWDKVTSHLSPEQEDIEVEEVEEPENKSKEGNVFYISTNKSRGSYYKNRPLTREECVDIEKDLSFFQNPFLTRLNVIERTLKDLESICNNDMSDQLRAFINSKSCKYTEKYTENELLNAVTILYIASMAIWEFTTDQEKVEDLDDGEWNLVSSTTALWIEMEDAFVDNNINDLVILGKKHAKVKKDYMASKGLD